MGRMRGEALAQEVLRLKRERNAVILAHSYQLPEVQEVADFVGDSWASPERPKERGPRSSSSAASISWRRPPPS